MVHCGNTRVGPLLCRSAAAVGLFGVPGLAHATDVFTPPPGVSDYYIAFNSADTTDATSSSIATYNSFVASEAAQNTLLPSTTWYAIGSTATTDALANLGCPAAACSDVPVYLVDGTEVATSLANLFAGVILNTIDEDQFGNNNENYVWTGSNSDGTASTGNELGSSDPEIGWPIETSIMIDIGFSNDSTSENSVYGIGQIVTAVPEPASGVLLAIGGLAAAAIRRRLRR